MIHNNTTQMRKRKANTRNLPISGKRTKHQLGKQTNKKRPPRICGRHVPIPKQQSSRKLTQQLKRYDIVTKSRRLNKMEKKK